MMHEVWAALRFETSGHQGSPGTYCKCKEISYISDRGENARPLRRTVRGVRANDAIGPSFRPRGVAWRFSNKHECSLGPEVPSPSPVHPACLQIQGQERGDRQAGRSLGAVPGGLVLNWALPRRPVLPRRPLLSGSANHSPHGVGGNRFTCHDCDLPSSSSACLKAGLDPHGHA